MQKAVGRTENLLGQLLAQKWTKLAMEHPAVAQGEYPGVYLLAFTAQTLQGKDIKLSDVFYVGMSNSRGGVNQRLRTFVRALEGRTDKHVAGKRFFRDERWGNGTPYSKLRCKEQFFATGITIQCKVDKERRGPEDLRMMGEVAALEYHVLAAVKEKTKAEPPLNKK